MHIEITFEGLNKSPKIEEYVNKKLEKVKILLTKLRWKTPIYVEVGLKSNNTKKYNEAEVHVSVPHHDLNTHSEESDIYVAIDNAINKMLLLIRKEHELIKDKRHKVVTPKEIFIEDDKYSL